MQFKNGSVETVLLYRRYDEYNSNKAPKVVAEKMEAANLGDFAQMVGDIAAANNVTILTEDAVGVLVRLLSGTTGIIESVDDDGIVRVIYKGDDGKYQAAAGRVKEILDEI